MTLAPGGSEFNRTPGVRDGLHFPGEVYLVDSTIRSLQSGVSGSSHSAMDLVDIGMAIAELGVRELIVNVSWRDGPEVIERRAAKRVPARLVATFRARNERWSDWVRSAADAGAHEICLESARDADHLRAAAEVVRSMGLDVSHAFAETFTYRELVEICTAGVELDCRSQSFHDSFFRLGIHPEAMKWFIRRILEDVQDAPPLYVHLSNFYGHATMTGVAAVTAGATAVDVCANGTGHHCGHTSLAEVALVLEHLYGVSTGIRLERLRSVAKLLEERTQVPVPLTQPVVGPYAFMGDGAYWAAEAHLPFEERIHATFPFAPDVVGSEERVVWNDRTLTVDAVGHRLRAAGISVTEAQCAEVITALRDILQERGTYPGWLSDEEFEPAARETVAHSPTLSVPEDVSR
jgi:isopropylmalate/homocitrate/citramalate synthase